MFELKDINENEYIFTAINQQNINKNILNENENIVITTKIDYRKVLFYKTMFTTLKTTFSMEYNFNYGFGNYKISNPKNNIFAIPYKAVNSPIDGSSFSNIELTIILTIISYLREGIFYMIKFNNIENSIFNIIIESTKDKNSEIKYTLETLENIILQSKNSNNDSINKKADKIYKSLNSLKKSDEISLLLKKYNSIAELFSEYKINEPYLNITSDIIRKAKSCIFNDEIIYIKEIIKSSSNYQYELLKCFMLYIFNKYISVTNKKYTCSFIDIIGSNNCKKRCAFFRNSII